MVGTVGKEWRDEFCHDKHLHAITPKTRNLPRGEFRTHAVLRNTGPLFQHLICKYATEYIII